MKNAVRTVRLRSKHFNSAEIRTISYNLVICNWEIHKKNLSHKFNEPHLCNSCEITWNFGHKSCSNTLLAHCPRMGLLLKLAPGGYSICSPLIRHWVYSTTVNHWSYEEQQGLIKFLGDTCVGFIGYFHMWIFVCGLPYVNSSPKNSFPDVFRCFAKRPIMHKFENVVFDRFLYLRPFPQYWNQRIALTKPIDWTPRLFTTSSPQTQPLI